MAKQIYNGPPSGMYPLTIDGKGWRYGTAPASSEYPNYTFWTRSQHELSMYPSKHISLWWNGARWGVWVYNLFVGESTEFTDINDPPIEWAEGVYTLTNN